MQENLLDSPELHGRLCLSSCILAELLRRSPQPADTGQLAQAAGHAKDEVEQMCKHLVRHGLLHMSSGEGGEGRWQLAGDPAAMTLADLFSALLAPADGHPLS